MSSPLNSTLDTTRLLQILFTRKGLLHVIKKHTLSSTKVPFSLLFAMFMFLLAQITDYYNIPCNTYADDTQFYITGYKPTGSYTVLLNNIQKNLTMYSFSGGQTITDRLDCCSLSTMLLQVSSLSDRKWKTYTSAHL